MEGVQKVALEKAIRLLDSLKFDYAIVIPDEDAIIKGKIQIINKQPKRTKLVPYGTYSTLFRSHGVDQMAVGDVLSIPCGEHDPQTIKKTIAAHFGNTWGAGSCVAAINGQSVEVMRVENGK